MKTGVKIVGTLLILVGLLVGCDSTNIEPNHTTENATTLSTQHTTTNASSTPTKQTEATTPNCFSSITWEEDLDFGKLEYTLTGVHVVTNQKNIPAGGFRSDAEVSVANPDGGITRVRYPDFVDDDGSFPDEVKLILLDISVKSHDATNRMIHPENGEVYWYYNNEYIFRADAILCLIDKTEFDGMFYWYYDPVFFSLWEGCKEDPTAYELLPGQSVDFTIGFLLGMPTHGNQRDMSQVVASNSWGSLQKLCIELNLEGN